MTDTETGTEYELYDEDDYLDDEDSGSDEWQEGQCDGCSGSTPEELQAAATGRSITPVCACAIGQGADEDGCRCGPEGEEQ